MKFLAVDDDSSVLQALIAALRTIPGHTVRAAANGEQALKVAQEMKVVDLLVTDVVMDPVDGLSLRNELLGAFPNLRTLFISGYDLSGYEEQIAGTPVLAKPLDLDVLRRAVAQELEQILPPAAAAPEPAPAPAAPAPVAAPIAATPVRAAVPVAKPAAQPTVKAVPVARTGVTPAPGTIPAPRAVPKTATPAAVPRAATPAPVARATPAAVPKAATPTPAARAVAPRAAAPTVKAAPKAASPVARGAGPQPVAPVAVPVAPIVSNLTPPPPATLQPSAEDGIAFDLLGQTVGGYQISALLGHGRWGPIFAAVQTAINRNVSLKILDPSLTAQPGQKDRFIADARAKAGVQHPSILSVYEAGSAEPWIFYTQEYVDGQNLAQMAASGFKIDQPTALKILRVAADGLLYFERGNVPHTKFSAGDVFLASDGQPRLANLATQLSDQQTDVREEMEILGRAIIALLPPGPQVTAAFRGMLGRTFRTNASALTDWAGLLGAIKALEPRVVPVEAAKISAQDRAAVEAVEKARRQQKRAFLFNVAAMLSLLCLALFVAYLVFFRSNERRLNAQVHIAAGDFISGSGVNSHNNEFWIDKYEVTIGQYAKFVQYIEANPGEEHSYDHPRQPRHLSHIPEYWAIYYGNAAAGKAAHSAPISLNSPMQSLTWWDAYAYAKWRGRELPTELEWERAARGQAGNAFPWGEAPDPKRANTNSDYNGRDPGAKGNIDGANFWGDVDSFSGDKSPDGVFDMAGNVSEWTATWTPDNQFPIIKGGNFMLPLQPLNEHIADTKAEDSKETIGFRTISHTPPGK